MAPTRFPETAGKAARRCGSSSLPFVGHKNAVDVAIASLFASSAGPVQQPSEGDSESIQASQDAEPRSQIPQESSDDESLHENIPKMSANMDAKKTPSMAISTAVLSARREGESSLRGKRKHAALGKDQRADFLPKTDGREINGEENGERKRLKPSKADFESVIGRLPDIDGVPKAAASPLFNADFITTIRHEKVGISENRADLDKAARTVFLGNVSIEAITSKSAKKTLLGHLSSFAPSLPPSKTPHKVESLRFRSTAFGSRMPKKAAFINKHLMDATTKSTNAYAVYSTPLAAREAVKHLNGSVVLGRHLRVDGVMHPTKIEHHRCVFVGNLSFVDDENITPRNEVKSFHNPEQSHSGDLEEGLWRHFGEAGKVESVRVVRDQVTRVGKGFAYVQFTDQSAVESALLFNGKKFPPLLPRKLRVVRAKARNRKTGGAGTGHSHPLVPRTRGRDGKLFGRATAAQLQRVQRSGSEKSQMCPDIIKPKHLVFKGIPANKGNRGLDPKHGRSGPARVKPETKSSKRAAAWKAFHMNRMP